MATSARALDELLRLTLVLQQDMTTGLASVGLTPARAHLVWVLAAAGPTTQVALARALDVTPRNVTGLVDGLVRDGLVTREPDPQDRRATRVTLTETGSRVAEGLVTGRAELADRLFEGLGEARVQALGDDLALLADRLETLVAQAAR